MYNSNTFIFKYSESSEKNIEKKLKNVKFAPNRTSIKRIVHIVQNEFY